MHAAGLQVARGRAIVPANKRHLELEPTVVGKTQSCAAALAILRYDCISEFQSDMCVYCLAVSCLPLLTQPVLVRCHWAVMSSVL